MSPPKDLIRLQHMLDYSREALELIQEKSRDELDSNRVLSLALVPLLEMIGEAANRVSAEYQSNYPAIPWTQIIGLRNRLIHGYDAVDGHSLGNPEPGPAGSRSGVGKYRHQKQRHLTLN